MRNKITYILLALAATSLLTGFTSSSNFPAPVKEPVAALYVNLDSSGIFADEDESQQACIDIAETVGKIWTLRQPTAENNTAKVEEYKSSTLRFLQDSIVNGFLGIKELYFYYKTPEEYALIAQGDFDIGEIAKRTNGEMLFNEKEELSSVLARIAPEATANNRLFLQANRNTILICPENASKAINEALVSNQNRLGEDFSTFEQFINAKAAIGAEIRLQELLKGKEELLPPKTLAATRLLRVFVAQKQNKLQISIPEKADRDLLKEELSKKTQSLNAIFDNKTDYKLAEGKTSLFIETTANSEQMQAITRKLMGFMLHFFIKNEASIQTAL